MSVFDQLGRIALFVVLDAQAKTQRIGHADQIVTKTCDAAVRRSFKVVAQLHKHFAYRISCTTKNSDLRYFDLGTSATTFNIYPRPVGR